jgi:hypothetical protein
MFKMLKNNKGFLSSLGSLGSLGSMFGGSKGSSGSHGIDVAYIDEYEDYPAIRQNLIDYYTGIMQGQEPEFFQRYLPGIESEMEQSLNRYYLGDAGDRSSSAMGLAGQVGAATGVGPKATFAQQGKVANELAAKKAAAKAAMQQYRMNWMGQGQNMAQAGLSALPRAQTHYAAPYNVAPGQSSPGMLQGLFSEFGSNFLGNAMGQGGIWQNMGKAATPGATNTALPTHSGGYWDQGSLDTYFGTF